ncbi:MAG: hypothetical protein ABEJ83_05735 [Candidatus Nanohaloarchaea archaeon]
MGTPTVDLRPCKSSTENHYKVMRYRYQDSYCSWKNHVFNPDILDATYSCYKCMKSSKAYWYPNSGELGVFFDEEIW